MRDALKSWRARRGRGAMSAAVAALAAGLVFGAGDRPALAKESVIIGGRGLPAVVVNLEVLKELGAPLQRRRLRMPGQGDQDADLIRLKPPPGVRAREVTIRTPRTRPERSASARTGPESPGRDPSVRLRQPGEERSRTPARSTRRALPAVPTRPVERQVLAPPTAVPTVPTVSDKKETTPPIRAAERRRREPAVSERREQVTPPPAPPRRAVERVITRPERSGARAKLPAPEQTAKAAEPPPLPPRVITREATEPVQDKQVARVAPEPPARPRPLLRPESPHPAEEPRRRVIRPVGPDKPPITDPAAPTPVRPAAEDEAPAPVRSTVRAEPVPPVVRPAPPRETRTAALPPARARVVEKEALRVVFSGSSSRLTEEGESGLRALVQSVAETETRIQLKAFAAGSADRPSTARRLSLSRALAVRSFLIEQGMRSTRIDVRALGVPADDGPADRVDVILLTQ